MYLYLLSAALSESYLKCSPDSLLTIGSQRLSGRYYDWNTDNSQDGDNASVSIVSPDATDNKELNL